MTPIPPRIFSRQVKTPPIWLVALTGEHDLSTRRDLETVLTRAVASGDPVLVDLEYATFADSSIFGAVIEAGKGAGPRRFAVVRPRGGVASRAFQVAAERAMLLAFPTQRHAVQWFYPGDEARTKNDRRPEHPRRVTPAHGKPK